MNLQQAKTLARQWVEEETSKLPGFYGAFFHGSVNWLSNDAVLDSSSDLDIMVVFDVPPEIKLGKIIYNGLMLEISYMARGQLQSAEEILATSYLAGSFHKPSVIADPTGELTQLQKAVAAGYAKRAWVTKRCQGVETKILKNLGDLQESPPVHTRPLHARPFYTDVTNWLFSTSLTTHILLVAGLKNPTVRKRYVATKALLEEYAQVDFQETLLEMIGCQQMTPAQVQAHLNALVPVFDATTEVVKTPIFFASDLSQPARPIAINGSQALINQGLHREAIFWIVATYARCMHVLHVDGTPEQQEQFRPGFRQLVADLGIQTLADMTSRANQMPASLAEVWKVAEAIMAGNPDIER